MPKFLANCRYNEEQISRHLGKKKEKDISRSKLMATSLQPVKSCKKKPSRSCEGGGFQLVELKSLPNPASTIMGNRS
jgi:hypothetical protein